VRLAVLAKGLAGLGLPVIVFLAYLAFTWNWKRLRRAQICPGCVATLAHAVVAVPWHHAMYIRHGGPWWNELFGDNHWRRMVLGRHGDRGTFEYFCASWATRCCPGWRRAGGAGRAWSCARWTDARRQAVYWLGAIWFVAGYAVVSTR
jgi:4-amino-4-deoxy-L-arabinose transferase-like glycosyltransferase